MKTFAATLQQHGQIPSSARQKVKLTSGAFQWKEYRVATKNVLCATANALCNSIQNFTMKSCQPPNFLKGAGSTGERMVLMEEEKLALGLGDLKSPCMWIYDYKTQERTLDCYQHENFTRLVFAADEGTEVRWAKIH